VNSCEFPVLSCGVKYLTIFEVTGNVPWNLNENETESEIKEILYIFNIPKSIKTDSFAVRFRT
jgi:hypothetical protein